MTKRIRFVAVFWNDAQGSATKVYEKARDHAPVLMETRGWLLDRDDDGVSVASERWTEDGETHYRGHTFIPAGMVVKVSSVR